MTNPSKRIIRTLATTIILASLASGCASGKKSSDPSSPSSALEKAASKVHENIGDAEWQKLQARLESVNQDVVVHGILTVSNYPQPLETGYVYQQFYDWDLYFENLYLSYNGVSDFCFNNFAAFMALQKPDGFIQRSFGPKPFGLHQPFKPFLAQLAVLGSKQRGDNYEWLRARYYDQLEKYLDRWFAYDRDSNGLPVWESADATGMDNQIRRSGKSGSFFDEGVDLACYLHQELEAMALIAGKLGKTDDQNKYLAHAEALAKKMNAVFWDDKEGFYFDRNEKTGEINHLKSGAGFLPMWAGIASPEQARRLVTEHLLNTNEFWLEYPIATYARTESDFYEGRRRGGGCNWQGPVWIPINYMVFHGLMRYGFKDAARDLAYRTFAMALDENPVTREYYDSDTAKGNGMNPFWGWSTLSYVLPLEFESGYNPMDLNGDIQPALTTDLKIPWPHSASP